MSSAWSGAEIKKKSVDEPQAALNAKYNGFLTKLKDSAVGNGDLDQALALTAAIDEFAKGIAPDGTATNRDLKRAQDIFLTESANIRAAHAKEVRPFVEAYQKRLAEMVTELTKADQLEAAVTARRELEAMVTLLNELNADAVAQSAATTPVAPGLKAPPPSTAQGSTRADLTSGTLKGTGYFYGNLPVKLGGLDSANRFVSVLPQKSFGWVGLRSNGTVATNQFNEVTQFQGSIVKLGTSELRSAAAGIDSTGRLQVVSTDNNPIDEVPKMEKRVTQFCISSQRGGNAYLGIIGRWHGELGEIA